VILCGIVRLRPSTFFVAARPAITVPSDPSGTSIGSEIMFMPRLAMWWLSQSGERA
jgi:hypothetical protein